MPVIYKSGMQARMLTGVWEIAEPEATLASLARLAPGETEMLATMRHPLRRKQWLACRILVKELSGDPEALIGYGPSGEPLLAGGSHHISLSHTGNYAAAILSADHPAGIDIELLRERILRVADRFLAPEERSRVSDPCLLDKLYIHWSAKEALYKLYAGKQPDLQNGITLRSFDYLCTGSGTVDATVLLDGVRRLHRVSYLKTSQWLMAYVADPGIET